MSSEEDVGDSAESSSSEEASGGSNISQMSHRSGQHSARRAAMAVAASALTPRRVSQFRPFLKGKRCVAFRSGKRAPPQTLVSVLEDHESAEEGYEVLVKAQILQVFDMLAAIVLPDSGNGVGGGGGGSGGSVGGGSGGSGSASAAAASGSASGAGSSSSASGTGAGGAGGSNVGGGGSGASNAGGVGGAGSSEASGSSASSGASGLSAGGGSGSGSALSGALSGGLMGAENEDQGESLTSSSKSSHHRRSKSISARHKSNVMKDLAALDRHQSHAAAQANVAQLHELAEQNEAAKKRVISDLEAIMDACESLMLVEDLTWAGLFHRRYLYTQRLLKQSEMDHMKASVECLIANSTIEEKGATRKMALKLVQYLVSHCNDPDGSVVGLPPSVEICSRLHHAYDNVYGENARRPELHDKILTLDGHGAVCAAPSSGLSHGMLLIARTHEFLPGTSVDDAIESFRFVRFARLDPTRTSVAQVWLSPYEKEMRHVELSCGVFALDESMKQCLSHDAKIMGRLVFNPLTPLYVEVSDFLHERVEAYLKEAGCDMYLLGLTEQSVVSDDLDLSKYEDESSGGKLVGQALCTKLLSLFDVEKKKLTTVISTVKSSELEGVTQKVADRVDRFMSVVDASEVFMPARKKELDEVNTLALRSIVDFQQLIETRLSHLESLIDFVIVNWKKLSDAKGRGELKSQGGSTTRTRTVSRGSMKSLFLGIGSKNKEGVDPLVSPSSTPNSNLQASVSSPQLTPLRSKAVSGDSSKPKKSLRNLFTKKE